MKTTIFLATALSLISALTAEEIKIETLTGDKKLACEAILCLSSQTRPSECNPSLNRYFGIHHKKHWKTINARRDFLNQCPIDNKEKDRALNNLMNDVLPNSDDPKKCTADYLNTQHDIEYKNEQSKYNKNHTGSSYKIRITTKMPNFCVALVNHQYTDYKIAKYTCDQKFYSKKEWDLNAELKFLFSTSRGRLSKKINASQQAQINSLQNQGKLYTENIEYNDENGGSYIITYYYEKIPFTNQKKCWVE